MPYPANALDAATGSPRMTRRAVIREGCLALENVA